MLSSLFRAAIFFFTNLAAGWHAAVGALLAELALRAATSGFYGAVTEAFSEARPVWAAMAAAMVVLAARESFPGILGALAAGHAEARLEHNRFRYIYCIVDII